MKVTPPRFDATAYISVGAGSPSSRAQIAAVFDRAMSAIRN